ncbi:MAG: cell division protein CrgA [Actinomycetaceae bacterium]|nr:cell division protein CrgA [Actinomycetaceae bacterium]
MPKSRKRKNARGRRVEQTNLDVQPTWTDGMKLSPSWWAPTMVTLMLIGLVWVVTYYMFKGLYPIPGIGNWNLAVGLGIAFVGFLMTLRWR